MICPPEWLRHRFTACNFLLFTALLVLFPQSSSGYEIYIGTGEVGTFSYFAGKTVCRAVSEADEEIICQPVPQESSAESLTNLQSGALDFALVDGRAIGKAARGEGQFQYVDIGFDTVRLLFPLYHEAVVVIAGKNTGIDSLDDLVDRRVNGGAPASRESSVFKEIMTIKGWDAKTFALYQNLPSKKNQDTIAFKAGTVEAMVYVGIFPDNSKQKEIERMGGRVVPLDDTAVRELASPKNGFGMVVLHPPDLPDMPKGMVTLGTEVLLLTTSNADRQTVLSIMRSLAGKPERLRRAHQALLPWKIDRDLLDNRPVAPHPEAKSYLTKNQM